MIVSKRLVMLFAPLRRSFAPFLRIDGALFLVLLSALVTTLVLTAQSHFRTRIAYGRLQALQQERDEALERTGRLLLERSTLASLARVDQRARSELEMVVPGVGEIETLEDGQ